MSHARIIAGLVVRVTPGQVSAVILRLARLDGVDVVELVDDGVALVTEAPSARDQEALHDLIRSTPGVVDVAIASVLEDVA